MNYRLVDFCFLYNVLNFMKVCSFRGSLKKNCAKFQFENFSCFACYINKRLYNEGKLFFYVVEVIDKNKRNPKGNID